MSTPPSVGSRAVPRRVVLALGVSQLIGWGVTYYLVGVLGTRIAAGLGLSPTLAYAGFSGALVVMGLVSPAVGRAVERRGGRPVTVGGSLLASASLALMAATPDLSVLGLVVHAASWIGLGVAMRMILYDAAFAALARLGGRAARGPIAQITLLGGLASTVFWPIGDALADAFGWRAALLAYAGFALLTAPLHALIPDGSAAATLAGAEPAPPRAATPRDRVVAGALYALIVALTTVLNAAMSAHMIPILAGLGAGAAVGIGTLRGIGQSGARLAEVLAGRRLDPLVLNVGAAAIVVPAFVLGLWAGVAPAAGIAFALLYGAGNGLSTIVRGTLPLVLFDPATYGGLVGRLVAPSFYASALAPLLFAAAIERWGPAAALEGATAIAALVLVASLVLLRRFSGGASRDAGA